MNIFDILEKFFLNIMCETKNISQKKIILKFQDDLMRPLKTERRSFFVRCIKVFLKYYV